MVLLKSDLPLVSCLELSYTWRFEFGVELGLTWAWKGPLAGASGGVWRGPRWLWWWRGDSVSVDVNGRPPLPAGVSHIGTHDCH